MDNDISSYKRSHQMLNETVTSNSQCSHSRLERLGIVFSESHCADIWRIHSTQPYVYDLLSWPLCLSASVLSWGHRWWFACHGPSSGHCQDDHCKAVGQCVNEWTNTGLHELKWSWGQKCGQKYIVNIWYFNWVFWKPKRFGYDNCLDAQ